MIVFLVFSGGELVEIFESEERALNYCRNQLGIEEVAERAEYGTMTSFFCRANKRFHVIPRKVK